MRNGLALAAMAATLAAGAFSIDWIIFDRVDYLADVRVVDPVRYSGELIDEGRYADAEEYAAFWLSLPGVAADDRQARQVEANRLLAHEKRSELSYQAAEVAKGFLLGESEEDYGRAAGVAADFTLYGDFRDLVREASHWLSNEEVDVLIAALAGAGIGITALSFGPQAGASGTVKAGLSALKAAKRSKRVPVKLFEEAGAVLADAAKSASRAGKKAGTKAGTKVGTKEASEAAFKTLARLAPLVDLARFAEKEGARAGLEVLARSEHLTDIPRVIRAAEPFGENAAAALRTLGPDFVRVSEKRGAAEVKAVARYGPDAVTKLERVPAKTFLRDMRHLKAIATESIYRVIRLCLRTVEILFSVITGLISVAGFLSSAVSWIRRFGKRGEAQSA
ncbi:hypothetical protein [uncultured Sutterella sp.]|uniref:hypothetical protein n=1 Tax=uncultured Sutterella sp. TaxID=286133 RepID=UPI0026017B1D|nr:hypothetical protein [uncultured Sutterella sp.]